ncbi:hypothetical protein TRIATDRAFT_299313 [Trichoderma atroviride IMI 206040]|uniref:Uncharacterized protein n=1 Tax=Hypocrea atroviridis (strain ATCC 20476 / IMI 206040) TaxID=452589 RepID=G9NU62_HYPAI|nr:uncharacterized protein TRIATDRAFT_299313 [Trichoderma atroviride IMI 206040]EHK45595.1 hypothetical protein TRIATDRAFT_299313 [Trichoderma atroviride IMI 206040]
MQSDACTYPNHTSGLINSFTTGNFSIMPKTTLTLKKRHRRCPREFLIIPSLWIYHMPNLSWITRDVGLERQTVVL